MFKDPAFVTSLRYFYKEIYKTMERIQWKLISLDLKRMSFLKKCVMKSCSLNALMYGTEYIIYLFSLFLTPLCQGSGYPDAKALLQNN